MYSRSFYPENEEQHMFPENYDGTAFAEAPSQTLESIATVQTDSNEAAVSAGGGFLSALTRIPLLSGLFGGNAGPLKMPKIGMEEILILATAAILFFSKEGDKECAIILLILLFIG